MEVEVNLGRRGLVGALPERLPSVDDAFIASTFVSTRAARTASRRATSMPPLPSFVETALSATSEVDGITVISSPKFGALRFSLSMMTAFSEAATVPPLFSFHLFFSRRLVSCPNDELPERLWHLAIVVAVTFLDILEHFKT